VSKGESLVDTLNTLAAMRPNAIVMRHQLRARRIFLARYLPTPIVNAGDGTHEHPTQALLDARTILDHKPTLEGLRIAIIGDIAHSRVAVPMRTCFEVRRGHRPVGPPTLLPPDVLASRRVCASPTTSAKPCTGADVIMMLRVATPNGSTRRLSGQRNFQYTGCVEHLSLAKPDAIRHASGPINRGREIASE